MIDLSAIIASFICFPLNIYDFGIKIAIIEFRREISLHWIYKGK